MFQNSLDPHLSIFGDFSCSRGVDLLSENVTVHKGTNMEYMQGF